MRATIRLAHALPKRARIELSPSAKCEAPGRLRVRAINTLAPSSSFCKDDGLINSNKLVQPDHSMCRHCAGRAADVLHDPCHQTDVSRLLDYRVVMPVGSVDLVTPRLQS